MSPAGAVLTGFLAAPTEQLGVPGIGASGEITPEGDIYTGWAEYEWRYGRSLRRWDQPTRTLPDPSVALFESGLSDGPVSYRQRIFAVPVNGLPVVYATITAVNGSGRPREAQLALQIAYTRGPQVRGTHGLMTGAYRYERPVTGQPAGFYEQAGQAFSPAFRYSAEGRDVDRSGLLLARGPTAASEPLPTPDVSSQTAPHDERLFRVELPARARASFTWQIPLSPPAAGVAADAALDSLSAQAAEGRLDALWADQEAGMMSVSLPEAPVTDAYRAALLEILDSRYESAAGWVQMVNRLQYQAFWIRDAAMEIQALDLAGLHTAAEQDLAFMDSFQQPGGLFISRVGQYDGIGQALWALGRHAQLTGSTAYASAQLARMGAAVGWIAASIGQEPLGLLPAGNPGDDELAAGPITGDDLWAVAGLREAVLAATLAARPDLAGAWRGVQARLESSLGQAIAAAVARTGHIPPLLEGSGGQDWGNYYAAYPVQVLPAGSAAITDTLAWARAHSVQGLPTYLNGSSLHDYLGFALFQTELERGERARALAGLYAELDHTTSTFGGWEWDIRPFGYRGSPVDMSPHGTFAADYVALLRNMLLSETEAGGVLLLDGAAPAWLAPGERISVSGAPVDGGAVSFTERSGRDRETLTWSSTLTQGTPLAWAIPSWARDVRTTSGGQVRGGTVQLAGTQGTVTVTFIGRRPGQSYGRALAALNAEYRGRGHAAPRIAALP